MSTNLKTSSDHRKAVRLASAKMVVSLKLSKNEVLLVQIPGKCPYSCYNMMEFNAVKEPSTTALLAAKKQVWCLTIKHDMTLDGELFLVDYDDNDSIAMLKKKIKEEKPNDYKNVNTDRLTVWRCKEPKLLADINAKKLENVDLSDCGEAV